MPCRGRSQEWAAEHRDQQAIAGLGSKELQKRGRQKHGERVKRRGKARKGLLEARAPGDVNVEAHMYVVMYTVQYTVHYTANKARKRFEHAVLWSPCKA
jgi:hypothetical protein